MAETPAFQFISSEADDAKWLIWGKILWKKGTRGSRYPDPNVLVRMTETAVIVKRFPQTFYYSGNIASPCPGRSLSIVVGGDTPLTWGFHNQVQVTHSPPFLSTWDVGVDYAGVRTDFASGSQLGNTAFGDYPVVWTNVPKGSQTPYGGLGYPTDNEPPGLRYPVFSGTVASPGAEFSGVSWWDAAEFIDVAITGSANPKNTLILLSDGTQLASIPYTDDGAGNKTNYPAVTTWAGEPWIQVYNSSIVDPHTPWVVGDRVAFVVPDDTTPPLPSSTLVIPSSPIYLNTTTADFGSNTHAFFAPYADVFPWILSTAVGGIGTLVLLTQQYSAGTTIRYGPRIRGDGLTGLDMLPVYAYFEHTEGVRSRERARVKTCSDNLKANIKTGVLQNQVRSVLRSGHLVSQNTSQATLMTASVSNSSAGSGDDITNTKTVTLSYESIDEDGNPVTLQQIVTGTQHIVITRCADSLGAPNVVSYTTTTYTNWLPITVASGSTGDALDYTYQLDNRQGLAQMWDGAVVVGASSIAATFDSSGGNYVPPYLQSYDARVFSYPQLYIDYRAATARKYAVGSHNTNWLDSAFKNGEYIDIFPISVIHSELGDLGMFPQASDLTEVSKLTRRIDMKATYRYNYESGVWTGSGADLVNANGDPAPIVLPYQAGVNCVFRSRTTPWPDVSADSPLSDQSYIGQAAAIKATPEDYPLFVPLLSV